MNVLVINSGSSSLKYEMFEMASREVLTSGLVERIGEPGGRLRHEWRSPGGEMNRLEREVTAADHRAALGAVAAALRESGVTKEVAAIGHRIVHGGETFRVPTRVDTSVLEALRKLNHLAPLHNPANVLGVELCLEAFPYVPQVAVFDTAFHQSIPPQAHRYALPNELYSAHHVRRYGFHGTSHAYVAKRAAEYLAQPLEALNLITLHLGNGASATAIAAGRSVDTSMGMTPLEGLVMGTRCGDIDPALVFYITQATGKSPAQVEWLLNRESGLKGLCGVNDMREILRRRAAGDERARLALDIYCYRIKKYIGAYMAVLGRVDALVFTAGIGENSPVVRQKACEGLEEFGVQMDTRLNEQATGDVHEIQSARSAVQLLVVHTDEELEIAEQTMRVLGSTLPGETT
ncbi:MAG: acetate kinase [Thiotrichales bacterium SG8_50]|nr:MAG: acetate kinase [Thiotrichales bacterium SG8_50]